MAGGDNKPHVVIIGGGFAGIYAAKTLKRAPVRVTILDRRNHHLFQPLLYQVATAALAAPDIAAPIRKIFKRQKNVTVLMAEVARIDAGGKRVILTDGEMDYDYLILAAGARDNYFGNPHWAKFAPGLKTIDDALEIRRRVLTAFEKAERETDKKRRRELMTFVVIGGGPTGVELAGALSEIARRTMARNFRNVDPSEARVILLEGSPRVLPPFDERLSESAKRQLQDLGVEVQTGTMVRDIGEGFVETDAETIRAGTILWGAGVKASPLTESLGAELDRGGRVIVAPDLSVPGHAELFAAGDLAAAKSGDDFAPGVAPAAIQMGRHAAMNIKRAVAQKETLPFVYADKGMLATIGRSRAVAQLGRLRFRGWIAWMLWLVIHIFFLIGFRNRVMVLLDWTAAYVTFNRGARIILEGKRGECEDPHPPGS
ncbi:MAG: NAD(P)/FAD-dependent oxidoreductase [Planctomycetes bacterium]|nr:NAD(P)/FAD-dependent oxidoreductase [Planctomycetota bacterium]